MDQQLLERARSVGVEVIEGSRVVGAELSNGRIASLTAKNDHGERSEIVADIFIDATGRSAVLKKFVDKYKPAKPDLIGFKAHLAGVEMEAGVCEIYFFAGGYGGLSHVEGGRSNFCFLVKSDVAKKFIGKTNDLFAFIQDKNRRAKGTLQNAVFSEDWIGVSVDGFGSKQRSAISNLFAVGDAGAFIDPFTGSGILMALQSSEILAICLEKYSELTSAANEYNDLHHKLFRKRLAVSRVLRHAAFLPKAASAAIFFAGQSSYLRGILARATRSGLPHGDTSR